MNIKQLDEHCRMHNEVLFQKKLRQFNVYATQWWVGKRDEYLLKAK